jgi:hypothetical protein
LTYGSHIKKIHRVLKLKSLSLLSLLFNILCNYKSHWCQLGYSSDCVKCEKTACDMLFFIHFHLLDPRYINVRIAHINSLYHHWIIQWFKNESAFPLTSYPIHCFFLGFSHMKLPIKTQSSILTLTKKMSIHIHFLSITFTFSLNHRSLVTDSHHHPRYSLVCISHSSHWLMLFLPITDKRLRVPHISPITSLFKHTPLIVWRHYTNSVYLTY